MKWLLLVLAVLVGVAVLAFGIREHGLHAQPGIEVTGASVPQDGSPAAANEEPPSSDPRLRWTAYSAAGHATLSQSCISPRECTLNCTDSAEKDAAWSVTRFMVADRYDYHFVSDDCVHAWIIYEVPPTAGGITVAPAAAFLTRGQLSYVVPVPGFVRRLDFLVSMTSHVKWLAGALNIPGRRPHYSDDGKAVELDAVDHSHHRLGFDLEAPPPEIAVAEAVAKHFAASASAPRLAGSGDIIEWKDDQGSVHFTQDFSEVPARFRKRARRTSGGEVSVVAGTKYVMTSHEEPVSNRLLPKETVVVVGGSSARSHPKTPAEPANSNRLWGPGTINPTYIDYINRVAPPALIERQMALTR